MKIAFYHYYWPHLIANKNEIFKNKISEYLVIYNLIKSLENMGCSVIKYSKAPFSPYSSQENIKIFRKGMLKIVDLINFFINPPEILGIVSKSIYHGRFLAPLLRHICRIRKVKFLIFMGHDESKTSMKILKDVQPYKYKEDVFWNNPKDFHDRIIKNNSYRPRSKNEYTIVPSKIIKNNCVKEGWSPNNIIVLPYGTDTNFFQPAKFIPKNNNTTKILFAGNGATRKGLSYLLKAFELLQTKYHVKLTVVSHNIKNLNVSNVTALENVTDNELLGLYQSHDIYVLPSLLDGWGLTAFEAMSCGLPIVVSNITGISDILHSGKNSFIVRAKNYQDLVRVISKLIENKSLRTSIGKNARKTALIYQWDNMANMFLNLLTK